MKEAYICEGSSGKTYGITNGETTLIQIEHPNGELGSIQEMDWPLARWKGQMGAEKCDVDEIPKDLSQSLP